MKIAIVGAGAAGMFCAANLDGRFDTRVFEASNAPLKKLLKTGGGRCNFTNENIVPTADLKNFYPRGAGSLRKPIGRFPAAAAVEFFASCGVRSKLEDGGKIFPRSDNAEDIARALLEKSDVRISLNSPVVGVSECGGKFAVRIAGDDAPREFDAVVFALGGHWGEPLKKSVESFGHTFNPEIPSLFGLCADVAQDANFKSGVALDARMWADFGGRKISVRDSLLTAHFGFTGPCALKFSSFAARELCECGYNARAFLDFLPDLPRDEISSTFKKARAEHTKKMLSNFCPFMLPQNFWNYILSRAGVAADTRFANLTRRQEQAVAELLRNFEFRITGRSPSKGEFVSCGGVDCRGVDFSTMQSRKKTGLFFLGECLDIDAITGGFNLHAAWATAKTCADFLNANF